MKKIFAAVITAIFMTATFATVLAAARFDTPYIGNSYRKTLHYRSCPSVEQMWVEHQVPFNTREEAIAQGYHPCGNCRP